MKAQNRVASVSTPVGWSTSVAVSSVEALMKTSEKPGDQRRREQRAASPAASAESRPCPSERATSSSPVGACATPARTATSASGKNMIA